MDTFESNITILGFSAFAGAFSAFLFLRIGIFFTKLYERKVKHYNALVTLETRFNDIGGEINDNLYVISNFSRVLTSGHVYFNKLSELSIDRSHYEKLYDIELLNDLFAYNYQLRKMNDDLKTINEGYEDIKGAFIGQKMSKEIYLENCNIIAKNLKFSETFLIDLNAKTIELIAKVRVRMKYDKPLGLRIQSLFIRTRSLDDKEVKKEREKVTQEVEESKKLSRKEINDILKDSGLN